MQNIQSLVEYYYDIHKPEVVLLRESSDNLVYLVKSRDIKVAVLRIGKRDTGKDVLFELEWIKALKSASVPLVDIIKTKKGQLYFEIDKSTGVMFEFVDGYTLKLNKNEKPKLIYINEAAAALADLHNKASTINLSLPRKRNIFTEMERVIALENIILNKIIDGHLFIDTIKNYLKWGKQQQHKNILINNDYRTGNVIFQGNSVKAIIDFDWSCLGPAIKDLGLALVEWSFPDSRKLPFDGIMDTFLSAYNDKALVKYNLDMNLYKWICFACLSDTSTYICDGINENKYRNIHTSYMFNKYQFYSKLEKSGKA